MLQIGSIQIANRAFMAPMCGITHKPFRKLVKTYGAGLVATQMVSAKALTLGDPKTLKLLDFDDCERPLFFQIFGNNATVLGEAAKLAQDMGPDGVDLNMGCPAKKIVNDGGGSALLKDFSTSAKILKKMRSVLKIPFTIKMRSGWDEEHGEAMAIAKMAEAEGVDAITLHARTRAQGYAGASDWDLIKRFKAELFIPIIGNGDIKNAADIHAMLAFTNCDAVMVGRAALSNPWIFKNYGEGHAGQPTPLELKQIILNQYGEFFEFFGEKSGIKQMRKHLCTYTRGMRNGAEFRNNLVRLEDWEMINREIENFFSLQKYADH